MPDPEVSAAPHGDALFERPPLRERVRALEVLRDETVGGLLLLVAAIVAMVWANSPWGDTYLAIATTDVSVGPLHLTVAHATADGLLAVFFFVAGLELKHEFVLGSLSRVSQAVVPVAAALGGMVLPALIYTAINTSQAGGRPDGWAIPMATDIAFALAVLAVVARRLPVALRAFLLTLAVVDDLGAIVVIALFYTASLVPAWIAGAVACFAVYWWAQRRRVRSPFLYIPLALIAWVCVYESGIHATVAGVALGLLTRVRPDPGEHDAPAERMQHLIQPFSAAVCVPLFALFAAGVDLRGMNLAQEFTTPVAMGVIIGLVVGKPIGVTLGAWATARFTRAHLTPELRWADVATVGVLAGIGFTVSLLISELAFEETPPLLDAAKLGVLTATLIASVLATIAIWGRNNHYRRLVELEEADVDGDGVPDVDQEGRDGHPSPESPGPGAGADESR